MPDNAMLAAMGLDAAGRMLGLMGQKRVTPPDTPYQAFRTTLPSGATLTAYGVGKASPMSAYEMADPLLTTLGGAAAGVGQSSILEQVMKKIREGQAAQAAQDGGVASSPTDALKALLPKGYSPIIPNKYGITGT